MKNIFLSFFFILLSVPCLGADTKAVINGPKESETGDLVVLDATQSEGKAFRWVLTNSTKTYLPVDGGTKVVFASGTPGRYIFVLVVGGADENNELKVDTAQHEVIIGKIVVPDDPKPPVIPDNPPVVIVVPEGEFGISKPAFEWAKKTNDKATALQLAVSFESLAAKAAAGGITSISALIQETAAANKVIAASNYEVWKNEFFVPLNVILNKLANDENKLVSMSDHVTCWNEIAVALKLYGESK